MKNEELNKIEWLLTKKQLVLLAVFLFFIGLLFFFGSIVLMKDIVSNVTSGEKSAKHVSQRVCHNSLKEIDGLSIQNLKRDTIAVTVSGLEEATLKLGKASIAGLVCPGWKLTSFCMGESCEKKDSLYFELQIID